MSQNENLSKENKSCGTDSDIVAENRIKARAKFLEKFAMSNLPRTQSSQPSFRRKLSVPEKKSGMTRNLWEALNNNNKNFLELVNENIIPIKNNELKQKFRKFEHDIFMQKTLSPPKTYRTKTQRSIKSAFGKRRENPFCEKSIEKIPNSLNQNHIKARVILKDAKPLFVVSTRNKAKPNARCTLGKRIETENLKRELKLYRINRGDNTAVIPMSGQLKPNFDNIEENNDNKKTTKKYERSKSTGRLEKHYNSDRFTIESKNCIELNGKRLRSNAKIRYLLQFIKK